MASSEVEIWNGALVLCGADRITSTADDSKEARLCALRYDAERKILLDEFQWNFSMARVELSALATAPVQIDDGYTYQFQLPADVLRVIKTDLVGVENPWRVEGRVILAEESALKILYISDITDVSKFSNRFLQALEARMASKICYALTQSVSLTSALIALASDRVAVARSLESQEGSLTQVEPAGSRDWYNSRF